VLGGRTSDGLMAGHLHQLSRRPKGVIELIHAPGCFYGADRNDACIESWSSLGACGNVPAVPRYIVFEY